MWIGRKEFNELCEQVGAHGNRIYMLEKLLEKKAQERTDVLRESMDLEKKKHKEMHEFFHELEKKIEEEKNIDEVN